jgi:hypothetical protein
MAESAERSIWDSVIELTKEAQEKGSDPLLWAMQLSSYLNSAGVCVTLPSTELADVLVSYICWENNVPILWKFLDKALVLNVVPPMLVLALLSTRFAVFDLFLFCFGCFRNLAFLGSWKWVFVECSFGCMALFCKAENISIKSNLLFDLFIQKNLLFDL